MGTGKTNVEFGGELENVDLDEATNDVNPPFRPVVQFYRSEAHSNNRFGAEEGSDVTTYGGKFGFDGFHQKVHAEGWVNKYEVLRNIELKKPIVKSYCKYLCAWASIWPPNVLGNQGAGREKITVWLKALEPKIASAKNEGEIILRSSDSAVKINGATTLNMTIGSGAQSIELECLEPFDEIISINAYSKDSRLVGRLNLYANNERFTTEIQPVKVIFGTSTSIRINEIAHESFIQNMLPRFNDGAYNQAYIQATLASHTHEITLDRTEFINPLGLVELTKKDNNKALFLKKNGVWDGDTDKFNQTVSGRYAAYLAGVSNTQQAKEEYTQAALAFVTELRKRYKYKGSSVKDTMKMCKDKIAYKAWNHPDVQALFPEVEAKRKIYEALSSSAVTLNKTGKIHVFYSTDIEGAVNIEKHNNWCTSNKTSSYTTPVGSWIPGYAENGSGVTFLYNSIFAEGDIAGTMVHEIGHTLGLKHPFDLTGKNPPREKDVSGKDIMYKDDYDKKIKDMEDKTLKSLKTSRDGAKKIEETAKKDNISLEEAGYVNTMKAYYITVNKHLEFIDTQPALAIGIYDFCRLHINTELIDGETTTGQTQTIKSLAEIQTEIDTQERELEKLKKLRDAAPSLPSGYDEAKDQSRTLENYMDYTQLRDSPLQAADVWRMLFYHWQWEEIRETGKRNGCLILNSN